MLDTIWHMPPTQTIQYQNTKIDVKRLDLVHPNISGNKFYKLKYNFEFAHKHHYLGVMTFGGAFSNHIAATAYAAHHFGFKSIGFIRGEELAHKPLNHTLQLAQSLGMQLIFISRECYKNKETFLANLPNDYANYYPIPEGGTNELAIQGCKEIITCQNYDFITCAVGTGGTISGIIEATTPQTHILGFSALKGNFLTHDVAKMTTKNHWSITDQYCFGGYAKAPSQLKTFILNFENQYQIPLEPIYTAKMFFGLFDLIESKFFPAHSRILAIHTGGLQGRTSLL